MIQRNTVLKLDPFASETPYSFREVGVYGRVDAVTPYQAADGKMYDSYTLGTIEQTKEGLRIRPCGYAYYVPAHTVQVVLGQWNPVTKAIE